MVTPLLYVAGDESGSLTHPHTAVVTAAAIMTYDPTPLRWIIPRTRRSVRQQRPRHDPPQEFKFHNTTDNARASVLFDLAKEDVTIVAVTIYKGQQVIADTPENYGLLLCYLFERCLFVGQSPVKITFDRHYTSSEQSRALKTIIQNRLALPEEVHFVDSQRDSLVQLADFVAGAVHQTVTAKGAYNEE